MSTMAKGKNTTDMTVGSPLKHLLLFAVPLLLGNLFQQMYNMVDSIVVGRYVGATALGAVGACGSLSFLFFSVCMGLVLLCLHGTCNGCGNHCIAVFRCRK